MRVSAIDVELCGFGVGRTIQSALFAPRCSLFPAMPAAGIAGSSSAASESVIVPMLTASTMFDVGVIVAVVIDELCLTVLLPRYTWDYAEALAAPASYAALAALIACTGGRRTA